MYQKYFHLKERPFSLLPDPSFIYWTNDHEAAFRTLKSGIDDPSPITLLTGEIGAGKTTLIRNFLQTVPSNLTIGLISSFLGQRGDLIEWILMAFGQDCSSGSGPELLRRLQGFLVSEHGAGRRAVLVIDEAQNVSDSDLESVRLLTDINAGQDVLLTLVLVGQPELRRRLMQPIHRQIGQRIGGDFHLGTMTRKETAGYVRHRLARAGRHEQLFDAGALDAIFRISSGVPRKINVLCDLCLASAFGEETQRVDAAFVERIVDDARSLGIYQSLSGDEGWSGATKAASPLHSERAQPDAGATSQKPAQQERQNDREDPPDSPGTLLRKAGEKRQRDRAAATGTGRWRAPLPGRSGPDGPVALSATPQSLFGSWRDTTPTTDQPSPLGSPDRIDADAPPDAVDRTGSGPVAHRQANRHPPSTTSGHRAAVPDESEQPVAESHTSPEKRRLLEHKETLERQFAEQAQRAQPAGRSARRTGARRSDSTEPRFRPSGRAIAAGVGLVLAAGLLFVPVERGLDFLPMVSTGEPAAPRRAALLELADAEADTVGFAYGSPAPIAMGRATNRAAAPRLDEVGRSGPASARTLPHPAAPDGGRSVRSSSTPLLDTEMVGAGSPGLTSSRMDGAPDHGIAGRAGIAVAHVANPAPGAHPRSTAMPRVSGRPDLALSGGSGILGLPDDAAAYTATAYGPSAMTSGAGEAPKGTALPRLDVPRLSEHVAVDRLPGSGSVPAIHSRVGSLGPPSDAEAVAVAQAGIAEKFPSAAPRIAAAAGRPRASGFPDGDGGSWPAAAVTGVVAWTGAPGPEEPRPPDGSAHDPADRWSAPEPQAVERRRVGNGASLAASGKTAGGMSAGGWVNWDAVLSLLGHHRSMDGQTHEAASFGAASLRSRDREAERTGGRGEVHFRQALASASRDPRSAAVSYARAALSGHQRAAYYLGQIYETGDGLPVDLALARRWYEAVSDTNARAARRLARLPEPDRVSRLGAPDLLLAEAGDDGVAEFVWTSSRGADPEAYVVEIAANPEAGVISRHIAAASAARVPLPPFGRYWRVLAVDPARARYSASGWARISPAGSGEAPAPDVAAGTGAVAPTVIIAPAEGPRTERASEWETILDGAGIRARTLPAGHAAAGTALYHFYVRDRELAETVAGMVPATGPVVQVRLPVGVPRGSLPMPGEILVMLGHS